MVTNLYFEIYFVNKTRPRKLYVLPGADALDTLILWLDKLSDKESLEQVKIVYNGKTEKRYKGYQIFNAPNYNEILSNATIMKDRNENLEFLMDSLFN